MKIIGYLLVVLGVLDIVLFWFADINLTGNIVGEDLSMYTPWALIAIGVFLTKLNNESEEGNSETSDS